MLSSQIPLTVFRPEPPPLWYVTNGELTVGPVVTSLLIRGVEYGRVPEDCHVRSFRGGWRTLDSVREVRALQRNGCPVGPSAEQLAESWRPIERIKDELELCNTVTWLSLAATGAESAMFHYRCRSARALITRSVIGPMSNERLHVALPEHDLLLRAARLARPVIGPPYGPSADALAMRFASSKGGAGAVAMIPIFVHGRLRAMLELSRPGHAFRRSDLQRAERIVQRGLGQRLN
jgi:hypothetical protein